MTENEKEQLTESIRDFLEVQTGICKQLATLGSQLEEQDKQLAAAIGKTQEHCDILETLKTDLSVFPGREQIADFTKELQTVGTDLR